MILRKKVIHPTLYALQVSNYKAFRGETFLVLTLPFQVVTLPTLLLDLHKS